jgi:hypothetical protein
MKHLLAFLALLAANAASADSRAHLADLDLTLSRAAASARLEVDRPTRLLVRLDRDITVLNFEVRPAGEAAGAGSWTARLVALPASVDQVDPQPRQVERGRVAWRASAVVRSERPLTTRVRAPVPRATYQNWILNLEPAAGAGAIEVRLDAAPVDWNPRVAWLLAARAQWQPQDEPERTRALMALLTDDEVSYWTGLGTRQVFLRVWLRMKSEEMDEQFPPGPESRFFFSTGHPLPNGFFLNSNGFTTPPGTQGGAP